MLEGRNSRRGSARDREQSAGSRPPAGPASTPPAGQQKPTPPGGGPAGAGGAAGAGDASGQGAAPRENIKETIESILVAFILAFVFRAFVVEAFVIPTGSMAPTLCGAHMRLRCEECGYEFPVNFPNRGRDDNLVIPDQTPAIFSMHCPNCGFKVRREGASPETSAPIPVYYGDRILVLKYLYLLQDPARWDVVVFKSPYDDTQKYQTNYIKRLIGRPGEAIMLLDGDVYACPGEKVLRDNKGEVLVDDMPWQVQSKPRAAQEAMWRVVYDNDYIPRNADWRGSAWVEPWKQTQGAGWAIASGPGARVVRFDNSTGAGTLFFDKDANPGTYPLTDWLPYDETMSAGVYDSYHTDRYAEGQIPRWYVSDLKLKFCYERGSGDGMMRAALTKLGHTFTAELLPGTARLLHRLPDGSTKLVREAKVDASGPLMVEFSNADYRVTLRINGRDIIQTTPDDYRPDIKALLKLHRDREKLMSLAGGAEQVRAVFGPPRVELSAEKQTCRVSHLSLWRDVYYTPHLSSERAVNGSPEKPVILHRGGNGYENEYFVLGDNSILSLDARGWTAPVDLMEGEDLKVEGGRVPERFMLGKAFFVYWPAGYRPFSIRSPGVIPDFGDLRFIH